MRGIYNNIEYIRGKPECYIYGYTQAAFLTCEEVDIFHGWDTKNTISRPTLEKLLLDREFR